MKKIILGFLCILVFSPHVFSQKNSLESKLSEYKKQLELDENIQDVVLFKEYYKNGSLKYIANCVKYKSDSIDRYFLTGHFFEYSKKGDLICQGKYDSETHTMIDTLLQFKGRSGEVEIMSIIKNINNFRNNEIETKPFIDSKTDYVILKQFNDLSKGFVYIKVNKAINNLPIYHTIPRQNIWVGYWKGYKNQYDERVWDDKGGKYKLLINEYYREPKGDLNTISKKHQTSDLSMDDRSKKEFESFQTITKPSPDSDLSNYLRKNIPQNLIQNISPPIFGLDSNIVRLTFEINKDNKPWNYRIKTGSKELDDKIKELFTNYPLEKLSLDSDSKKCRCYVQIFSKEKNQYIINASSVAVCDKMPVVNGCENNELYTTYSSCFYKALYNYIIENISIKIVEESQKEGEISISVRFLVDLDGNIYDVNCGAPDVLIKEELDRIIKLYPLITQPAMRNGSPKIFEYRDIYILKIDRTK